MASFHQQDNGKWRAQVYVNGKRKARTFVAKAKARAWAAEMEQQLSHEVGIHNVYTLADLLERYREEITPKKKSAKTEGNRIDLMIRGLGHYKLSDLTRLDIESWMEGRLNEVQPTTVKRYITILSNALKYGRRWEWILHNPLEDLMVLKGSTPRDRRISPEEEDMILLSLGYQEDSRITRKNQVVAVAFLFALETAMRSGEILSLTHGSVDTERRVAHLSADVTKTATKRDVPLSDRAIELLEKLKPWPEDGPIFQVSNESRDALFRKAVNRTPIKDLTFHDTRHEATYRLSKIFEVMDLARVTGHQDLKMLLRYYNPTGCELAQKFQSPS